MQLYKKGGGSALGTFAFLKFGAAVKRVEDMPVIGVENVQSAGAPSACTGKTAKLSSTASSHLFVSHSLLMPYVTSQG